MRAEGGLFIDFLRAKQFRTRFLDVSQCEQGTPADIVVDINTNSRPFDQREGLLRNTWYTIRIHIAHCDDSFDLPTIVVSCCALLDPSVPVRKTRQNNIRQNTFVDIFAHSHEFVLRWSSSLMNVPGSCLSDTLIGWRWCFMTLRLSYRVEF